MPLVRLLRLLHLASPALPIGAFHFSQGLEYAVERGWVHDEKSAAGWIRGVSEHVIAQLDLPTLHRLHEAFARNDSAAAQCWNARLLASRETSELRAEDEHMGAALARVIAEHGLDFSSVQVQRSTYAAVFAFACHSSGATVNETLTTYAWTWLENQVMAAIKLVPLGQTAGQRLLHAMGMIIPATVERAQTIADEDVGVGAVIPSLASAAHETQYTRLFRS